MKTDKVDICAAENKASKHQSNSAKLRTGTKVVDDVTSKSKGVKHDSLKSSVEADRHCNKETLPTRTASSSSHNTSSQVRPVKPFKSSHGRSNSAVEEKPSTSGSRREGTSSSRLGVPTLSQLAKVRTAIKQSHPAVKSTSGRATSSKTNLNKPGKEGARIVAFSADVPCTDDKHTVQPESMPLPLTPGLVELAPGNTKMSPDSNHTSTLEGETEDAKITESAHEDLQQDQAVQEERKPTETIALMDTTASTVDADVPEIPSSRLLPYPPLRLKASVEESSSRFPCRKCTNFDVTTPARPGRQDSSLTAGTATPISMLVRSIQQGFILSPIADVESPDTTIPYPDWQEDAENTIDELKGIEFDRDGVRADGTVIVSPRKGRLQTDIRKDLLSGRERNILADLNF